jgi:chromosome segregation ATPase
MDINRLAEVLEKVVKRLDQTDHVMERLDIVQNYIGEVKDKLERLDQKTDFIYPTQIVETRDKSSSEVELKDGRKLHGEIEQVKTSITSLAEHLDTEEKSMATVVQKIDSVKTSLKDGHKTVKEDLLSLKQGQNLVTTKIERSTNEVTNQICNSQREILVVTEKEAQKVRDRIEYLFLLSESIRFIFTWRTLKLWLGLGKVFTVRPGISTR